MKIARRGLVALGASVLAFGGAIAVSDATARDPSLQACGAYESTNHVMAHMTVANGRDVHSHVPLLGKTPEVDDATNVTIVLFDKYALPMIMGHRFNGPATKSGPGYLCLFADGVPNIYSDVDFTGWSP